MRGLLTPLRQWLIPAMILCACASGAAAQDWSQPVSSPILTLDTNRLITESAAGRAVEQTLAEKSASLAAENRRIEAELTAEEKDLTERRSTLSSDEFRAAAAAFDEKVQTIRREQDAKVRALQDEAGEARREILSAADPVLVGIMQEAGAAIIMEKANVLASLQTIDITTLAVARLDQAMSGGFDTGTAVPDDGPTPEPDAPVDQTLPAPTND